MRSFGIRRMEYKLKEQYMGAFDSEYAGFLGDTIEWCYMDPLGKKYFFTDAKEMLYQMVDTPKIKRNKHMSTMVWAHNAEGAELPRMIEALAEFLQENDDIDVHIVAQGSSNFIAVILKLKGYTVTLCDSFAIVTTSARKMFEAFAPDYLKDDGCPIHNWYQLAQDDIFISDDKWHHVDCEFCHHYLERDVEGLWHSMHRIQAILMSHFHVNIGLTAGSIAMRFWKTTIPDGHAYSRLSHDKEEWLRESGMKAIHGGFVWPGHKRGYVGNAVTYDRSGAYAYQLRQGVPSGICEWVSSYRYGRPGIYEVLAYVPEDINIPIVPYSGKGPLYPTGYFRTRITSACIEYAEKLGCRFEIDRGLVWERIEYPFAEFVDTLDAMEYPVDGSECDTALKALVKWMRCSLVGKFAINPGTEEIHFGVDIPLGGQFYHDERTGNAVPLWHMQSNGPEPDYALPHWNIWLTDAQRIDIHRVVNAMGKGAYYADTDSLTGSAEAVQYAIDNGIIDVGIGYGKYHEEGLWDRFYVGGPKNKCGMLWNNKTNTYEWYSTAKGITKLNRNKYPERQIAAANGEYSEPMQWDSAFGMRRRVLNPHLGYGEVLKRSFSRLENSANWEVDADNNIRPIHVDMRD